MSLKGWSPESSDGGAPVPTHQYLVDHPKVFGSHLSTRTGIRRFEEKVFHKHVHLISRVTLILVLQRWTLITHVKLLPFYVMESHSCYGDSSKQQQLKPNPYTIWKW